MSGMGDFDFFLALIHYIGQVNNTIYMQLFEDNGKLYFPCIEHVEYEKEN